MATINELLGTMLGALNRKISWQEFLEAWDEIEKCTFIRREMMNVTTGMAVTRLLDTDREAWIYYEFNSIPTMPFHTSTEMGAAMLGYAMMLPPQTAPENGSVNYRHPCTVGEIFKRIYKKYQRKVLPFRSMNTDIDTVEKPGPWRLLMPSVMVRRLKRTPGVQPSFSVMDLNGVRICTEESWTAMEAPRCA